jgi:hypothetical protein
VTILDIAYQRDPTTGQMLFDVNGYPIPASNPGANTYGQLQARIQNEVLGSPSTSDIQNAIQDAIAMYEREPYWFNSERIFGGVSGSLSNLQTTAGKEFYSDVDLPILINIPHISKILVLAFGNRYPLNERTPQWIDDVSISTTWQGLPTDWAYQNGSLRIYPVPNGTYPLILDVTIRFAPLVNTSDYNPWTNRAERLIRYTAKMLLFRDIIRDADQAAFFEREIHGDASQPYKLGEYPRLKAESFRRTGGPGRLRASRGYL